MKELDDNKFLLELGKLYQAQDDKKGTVWLEFKRHASFFLFVAASAQPHNDCNEPFSDRFSPIVRGLQAHV